MATAQKSAWRRAISVGLAALISIPNFVLGLLAIIVLASWLRVTNVPAVILLEAVLGCLGIGVTSAIDGSEFTAVSWGGMFFSGRSTMSTNPLMLILPSLGILLISMSFILLADWLNGITQPEAG